MPVIGLSGWVMSQWYVCALLALVLLGVQRFLYKVSAEKRCNTAWTSCAFMATVTLLSAAFLLIRKPALSDILLLLILGAVNSGAFLAATMAHMEALKHLSATVVYPIIRLNVVLVVLLSLYLFNERLSPYQIVGILVAVAVILLLTRQTDGDLPASGNIKWGFALVSFSFIAGTLASITSKLAAMHVNSLAFMAISYFISTLASFGLRNRFATGAGSGGIKTALTIGTVMGLINFAGYYLMLNALSLGPLSIVISLVGMHFVIAVILSTVIYKEKMTPTKALGVALTIISVTLLRLH